jgi:hypothetical protein
MFDINRSGVLIFMLSALLFFGVGCGGRDMNSVGHTLDQKDESGPSVKAEKTDGPNGGSINSEPAGNPKPEEEIGANNEAVARGKGDADGPKVHADGAKLEARGGSDRESSPGPQKKWFSIGEISVSKWWYWLGGLVGVVLLGFISNKYRLIRILQKKDQNQTSAPHDSQRHSKNEQNSTGVSQLTPHLVLATDFNQLKQDVATLTEITLNLEHQVERLNIEFEELKRPQRKQTDENPREPRVSEEPRYTVPTTPVNPSRALSAMFVEWCRERGAMINRDPLLNSELQKHLPGASARTITRDLDSPARPIEFGERAAASPAEYWLVDYDRNQWLLPKPQSATQFRDDTEEVYSGRVRPCELREIDLAIVRLSGSTFLLTKKGAMR